MTMNQHLNGCKYQIVLKLNLKTVVEFQGIAMMRSLVSKNQGMRVITYM